MKFKKSNNSLNCFCLQINEILRFPWCVRRFNQWFIDILLLLLWRCLFPKAPRMKGQRWCGEDEGERSPNRTGARRGC